MSHVPEDGVVSGEDGPRPGLFAEVVRAKRPQRLPTVLSAPEVARLLVQMQGRAWLLASLLYGTGMRLMEGLRLRVL